jgi:hypothetical protein
MASNAFIETETTKYTKGGGETLFSKQLFIDRRTLDMDPCSRPRS